MDVCFLTCCLTPPGIRARRIQGDLVLLRGRVTEGRGTKRTTPWGWRAIPLL